MNRKAPYGTTTITLSIPAEERSFFDELAEDGYNRSFLMLGMTGILRNLYKVHIQFPGGLPATIRFLKEETAKADFFKKFPEIYRKNSRS